MIPPQAIFGIITGAYGLVKEIYTVSMEIWSADDEARATKQKLDNDKLLLEIFLKFFGKHEKSLSETFAGSIRELSDELDSSLKKMYKKLGEKKVTLTLLQKVDWPRVRGPIMEGEKSLSDWAQRLQIMFGLLPKDLVEEVYKYTTSDTYQAQHDPLVTLTHHIDMLNIKTASDDKSRDTLLAEIGTDPPEMMENHVVARRYIKEEIWIPLDVLKDEDQTAEFRAEVAKLAVVLKCANPEVTNIPKLKDWYQLPSGNLGLAYNVPSIVLSYDNTLKDRIEKQQPPQHNLSDRVNLAQDLVSAVTFVKGLDWVHKQINPWHIRMFFDDDEDFTSGRIIGRMNLVGFNVARQVTGVSYNIEEENRLSWKKQIYCHPARQIWSMREEASRGVVQAGDINDYSGNQYLEPQLHPTPSGLVQTAIPSTGSDSSTTIQDPHQPRRPYYQHKHDVYSLGVVLLEIGLWETLTPDCDPPSSLREAKPKERRQMLSDIASTRLITRMGGIYTRLVKDCLDVDNTKIEAHQVLARLSEIKL